MERKHAFIEGENYHIYSRGVEKRIVFNNDREYRRFMLLLLLCNSKETIKMANILKKYRGEPSLLAFEQEAKGLGEETLVDILAYALMPTHFHLIVRGRTASGISRFMLKIMTAYSMYFNIKYQRSGPLFTRPFRSKHIDSDEYFRWVFAYVLLNPLELFQTGWKEAGLQDVGKAKDFMNSYRYSSFQDYFGQRRPESSILSSDVLPTTLNEIQTIDDLLQQLASTSEETQ